MDNTQSGHPPSRIMGILLNSLSTRLFILMFVLIAAAFTTYTIISIRTMSQDSQHIVKVYAERFRDMIQRSTHYSMLLNRKEDVYQIIYNIAQLAGVEDVRIYDKQGVIIYSADAGDIGTSVDLDAEACITCHETGTPLQAVPVDSRTRIFDGPDGYRVMGLIDPIENAPECYNAACHAHSADQSILGVLDVTMSLELMDQRMAVARRRAVIGALVTAMMAGLLAVAFIDRMVRKPVHKLIRGAQVVASGNLDTEIEVKSQDELGQLATAFNQMTGDLRDAQHELTEWSNILESKLREKTDELSRTQQQIAHMDKMASLGKLAATVAHELNNPLAGILNYAKLVDRTIQESETDLPEKEELFRHLRLIQKEASRSGEIVRNLLIFARPAGVELALHSLNQILDRSVMLVRHHIEMSGIKLEMTVLLDDDQLVCDADQMEQAIVALLVNAVEAMPNGGTLKIIIDDIDGSINISIADSGVGIQEEALPSIFEPFFTSKEKTDGAGLGLAVVYGIIQRHQAHIEVESTVGVGTMFRIKLPRRQSEEEDQDE